jgi:hypothetical protein
VPIGKYQTKAGLYLSSTFFACLSNHSAATNVHAMHRIN